MTRRVALACSFALTVVVSFAIVTLGSSAGWFGGETEASTAAAPSQDSQPGLSPTPQVIVVDIPVVTAPAQKQQPVVASQQPPARQTAYRDDDRDGDDRYDDGDRHGDDDRYDDDHDDDDDDDDDDGGHEGRGRDHPEDD